MGSWAQRGEQFSQRHTAGKPANLNPCSVPAPPPSLRSPQATQDRGPAGRATNSFSQGMGFCKLETERGVMRRKESSREKMGCSRGRIPNRLSCDGARVISNCSIMRMPGKTVVRMVMVRTFRKGEKEEENQASWRAVAKPIRPLTSLRPGFAPPALKKGQPEQRHSRWLYRLSPAQGGLMQVNSEVGGLKFSPAPSSRPCGLPCGWVIPRRKRAFF